jgi:TP901 family phage tail tape measure protein
MSDDTLMGQLKDKLKDKFVDQLADSVSAGPISQIMRSAQLDKDLARIGQVAHVSQTEIAGLRHELFRMQTETGHGVDSLKEGFDAAVQSSLKMGEALPVLDAVNKGMSVSNATASQLVGSLGTAAAAFQFDLSKPDQALSLLDKMVVASRQGFDLQNLSDTFDRVGIHAASAGMGFEQTLAFIEGLSQIKSQPEELAKLANSTLQLLTNADVAKATGVNFFEKGKARDLLAVLTDLQTKYRELKTDRDRARWLDMFGKTAPNMKADLKILLSGDALDKVKEFTNEIKKALGTIEHDLPRTLDNSVDQVKRLKDALGEAGDKFAQPVNESIDNLIKYALDSKDRGGLDLPAKAEGFAKWTNEKTKPVREYTESKLDDVLKSAEGLSNTEIVGVGAASAVIALTAKFGPKLLGKSGDKAFGAGAEATPVFVVNMPGEKTKSGKSKSSKQGKSSKQSKPSKQSKLPKRLSPLDKLSPLDRMVWGAGLLGAAGSVASAGYAGWQAGSWLYNNVIPESVSDRIGYGIAKVMSLVSDDASRAIVINENKALKEKFARDYGGVGQNQGTTAREDKRLAPVRAASAEARRIATLAVPKSVKQSIDDAFPVTGLGSSAHILNLGGNNEARQGIEFSSRLDSAADKRSKIDLGGKLTIQIESPVPARVTGLSTNNPDMDIKVVHTGPTMVAQQ